MVPTLNSGIGIIPVRNIAFLDPTSIDYTVGVTVAHSLPAPQHAACRLALAMTEAGMLVTMVNGTTAPGINRGIRCIAMNSFRWNALRRYDVVAVLEYCTAESAARLRASLPETSQLVLWTHQDATSRHMGAILDPAVRGKWTGMAVPTEAVAAGHAAKYGLERGWVTVLADDAPARAWLAWLGRCAKRSLIPCVTADRIEIETMLRPDDPRHYTGHPAISEALRRHLPPGASVLEIGPGNTPQPFATHWVGWTRPSTLPGDRFYKCDVSRERLPFPDKHFDFVYCRHVVEDVFDPIHLCAEMSRVAKAGFVETPSPLAETCRGVDANGPLWCGYLHHRSVVWSDEGVLNVVPKYPLIEYVSGLHPAMTGDRLRSFPHQWNTYHLWSGELRVRNWQHEVDFHLGDRDSYARLLAAAMAAGWRSTQAFVRAHDLDMHGPGAALDLAEANYTNTAAANDAVFAAFRQATETTPLLFEHRRYVERNRHGYGERAFHALWLAAIQAVARETGAVRLLEIGVFKGQVLSLWALIAERLGLDATIVGITPLRGNAPTDVGAAARERAVGNIHPEEDYYGAIRRIFDAFGLDMSRVRVIEGSSGDSAVVAGFAQETFDIVYVDGDHSYEAACSDIRTFGRLVRPGGYVVVDDAASFLPGTFWKGFESVSRACEILPELGFTNTLNVGHNRLFRRDR